MNALRNETSIRPKVARFLAAEAALFAAASLVHAGVLGHAYGHARAATAEGIIAGVLILGLLAGRRWAGAARRIAVGVQAFALLGTLVGVFTIVIGVGPQTWPDLVFHIVLLGVLVLGIAMAARPAGCSKG